MKRLIVLSMFLSGIVLADNYEVLPSAQVANKQTYESQEQNKELKKKELEETVRLAVASAIDRGMFTTKVEVEKYDYDTLYVVVKRLKQNGYQTDLRREGPHEYLIISW